MEDIETEEIQDGIPDLESVPSNDGPVERFAGSAVEPLLKHKPNKNTRKSKKLPISVISQRKETYKEKIIDTILTRYCCTVIVIINQAMRPNLRDP